MKWRIYIAVIWCMMVLSSCSPPTQVVEPAEEPSEELQAIDSLMWRQPDSALAQLQRFVVSPEADSLDEFNGHYCQLLISELLYKNDCEQSNREELLQAVAYFDSLVREAPPPPLKGGAQRAGDSKKISNLTPNLVFLDARAHYINGVGYYENDSIVQACAEYLKALEVMEAHFEEKELVGKKAQFMAYIYNRLGDMFEEQLLAEPAITCYKQALLYCKREPTSIYGISVLLYSLGIQYETANQKDSAAFYYKEALENMPDFDNIHYRDIVTAKSVLAYNLGFCVDSVINNLKYVISLTCDEHERINRFLTLGNILFESRLYDSSRFYLETVFEQQDDIQSKIVAAENLCNIYQKEGDSVNARKYYSYLADFTMAEIEKKKDISRINELFKNHLAQKQEKQAELKREKAVKKALWMIVPIAIVVALVGFIVAKLRNKKQLREQKAKAKKLLEDKEKQYRQEMETKEAEARKELEERDRQHKDELRRRQVEAEKQLEDKEKHYQSELETKEAEARKEMEERDRQHEEELRQRQAEAEKLLEDKEKHYQSELETKEAEARKEMEERDRQHEEELRQRQAEAEKLLEDKEKHYQSELETKEAEARKEMEEKDKRHEKELEAERQTHQMQQAALSGRLKRSNEELRELRDLKRQQTGNGVPKQETQVVSFNDEPICRLIMERVNEGQFKSKIDYIIYKDSALDKQQLLDLRLAVDRHFGQFTARLKKAYPELTNGDLDYCCLYLLGLTDADIAALMQRTYNTVFHRNGKMRKIFGSENPLPVTLMGMAKDSSFI